MADAVDERSPDLVFASWKTLELQRDCSRSVLAIQLNPTAALVLAGVGADFEHAVGIVGRHVDSDHQLVGANDFDGETAIVSRSPALTVTAADRKHPHANR